MDKIFKFMNSLKKLLMFIMIIIFITSGKLFADGYKMYSYEINKITLTSKIESIRSSKNYLSIENIDKDFLKAIVSVEDKRFYNHGAIDIKGATRATITNLKAGRIVQGGSTITQQLAKNMYFSNEKNYKRKVAELLVARDLEENYSKDEILELYVNIINYGNNYIGIKEASEGYFSEEADDLDLNEATMLAGLPQSPNKYNPKVNLEKAIKRQKQVILAMKNNNIDYSKNLYLASK